MGGCPHRSGGEVLNATWGEITPDLPRHFCPPGPESFWQPASFRGEGSEGDMGADIILPLVHVCVRVCVWLGGRGGWWLTWLPSLHFKVSALVCAGSIWSAYPCDLVHNGAEVDKCWDTCAHFILSSSISMKAADKSALNEGCLLSSFNRDQRTAKTTWDRLYTSRQPENAKLWQIINVHFHFIQYYDALCLTKNLFKVDFQAYSSQRMESHSIWPKPACLNSQAITSWMRGHVINWEIHDGSAIWNTRGDRQSSLTRPFVTDASTSRRQRVRPYCMRTHRIVHNVSRLSKHYDGETSNENQSFCRDCMFLFWVIGLKWVCVCVGGVDAGAQSECFRSWLQLGLQALTLQIEVTLISCAPSSAVWVLKAPEKKCINTIK